MPYCGVGVHSGWKMGGIAMKTGNLAGVPDQDGPVELEGRVT